MRPGGEGRLDDHLALDLPLQEAISLVLSKALRAMYFLALYLELLVSNYERHAAIRPLDNFRV